MGADRLQQVEPGARALEVASGQELHQGTGLRSGVDRPQALPQAVEGRALVGASPVEPGAPGRQGQLRAREVAAEGGVAGVEGVALGAQRVGRRRGRRGRRAGEGGQRQDGEAAGGAGRGAEAHHPHLSVAAAPVWTDATLRDPA